MAQDQTSRYPFLDTNKTWNIMKSVSTLMMVMPFNYCVKLFDKGAVNTFSQEYWCCE